MIWRPDEEKIIEEFNPAGYKEKGKMYSVSAKIVDIDGAQILQLDVYPKNRKKPCREEDSDHTH